MHIFWRCMHIFWRCMHIFWRCKHIFWRSAQTFRRAATAANTRWTATSATHPCGPRPTIMTCWIAGKSSEPSPRPSSPSSACCWSRNKFAISYLNMSSANCGNPSINQSIILEHVQRKLRAIHPCIKQSINQSIVVVHVHSANCAQYINQPINQ